MFDVTSEATRKMLDGLKCAALQLGLRSIVIFNVSPHALNSIAVILKGIIEVVEQKSVEITYISTSASEDDIWGELTFSGEASKFFDTKLNIIWKHGLIQSVENFQIVIIPDLANLSIYAQQAAISLIDTPIAHLERHGQSNQWSPNIIWLAGCQRQDMGRISAHVLDRFVLRLNAPDDIITDRFDVLSKLLNNEDHSNNEFLLPKDVLAELIQSRKVESEFSPVAIDLVIKYFANGGIGARREIGLGRISKAYAQMAGSKSVTSEHVHKAASLIGLELPVTGKGKEDYEDELKPNQFEEEETKYDVIEDKNISENNSIEIEHQTEVFQGNEEKIDPVVVLQHNILIQSPWPEDVLPVEHEFASLRYIANHHSTSAERGTVIGLKKATSLLDISLVGTILESAKYHKVRLMLNPEIAEKHPIWATDLRSYRRESVPDEMLMLILDYTSMKNSGWADELFPYLQWAYMRKASVCVIQIGAAAAKNEFCAEAILSRSILNPKVGKALNESAGKATPLAHGLELAYRTLQKSSQHGKKNILHSKVVLLTDGRGNIPLRASQTLTIEFPVGSKGVEDAWIVARSFSNIKKLDIVVLKPDLSEYREFPEKLASILGAKIVTYRSI